MIFGSVSELRTHVHQQHPDIAGRSLGDPDLRQLVAESTSGNWQPKQGDLRDSTNQYPGPSSPQSPDSLAGNAGNAGNVVGTFVTEPYQPGISQALDVAIDAGIGKLKIDNPSTLQRRGFVPSPQLAIVPQKRTAGVTNSSSASDEVQTDVHRPQRPKPVGGESDFRQYDTAERPMNYSLDTPTQGKHDTRHAPSFQPHQPKQMVKSNLTRANLSQNQPSIGAAEHRAPEVKLQSGLPQQISAPDPPMLLLQPETRAISQTQLIVEVRSIYTGLVLVENKCKKVDGEQKIAALEKDLSKRTTLSTKQYQALIALHKTLLHEHHDFFLASQHPSGSAALKRVAEKNSMPARLWQYGIHGFLEVLRYRLPESLEHMLAWIYIAFSMMCLLYETVPMFEETWVECLGDLGRYRMAVEDNNHSDRQIWSSVSRYWYSKAADTNPHVGRLAHHLAILSRNFSYEQVCLYSRAVTCENQFDSAKTSVLTVFNPILDEKPSANQAPIPAEKSFIRIHARLFTGRYGDGDLEIELQQWKPEFLRAIARFSSKFEREPLVYIAITNAAAIFEYGASRPKDISLSLVRRAIEESQSGVESLQSTNGAQPVEDEESITTPDTSPPTEDMNATEIGISRRHIEINSRIAWVTLSTALLCFNDRIIYPFVHVSLVMLWGILQADGAISLLEADVPWANLVRFLNRIITPEKMVPELFEAYFPAGLTDGQRPLPEDWMIRGLIWCKYYFPNDYMKNSGIDEEERSIELPSMAAPRAQRIIWLALRIASVGRWITYDPIETIFLLTDYTASLPDSEDNSTVDIQLELSDEDSMLSEMDEDGDDLSMGSLGSPPFKRESYFSQSSLQQSSASHPGRPTSSMNVQVDASLVEGLRTLRPTTTARTPQNLSSTKLPSGPTFQDPGIGQIPSP
ncbi:hypothetical protein MMC25_001671 [Agyrium rufum]|nr:hypothetical protein [Agyrium rufum]